MKWKQLGIDKKLKSSFKFKEEFLTYTFSYTNKGSVKMGMQI